MRSKVFIRISVIIVIVIISISLIYKLNYDKLEIEINNTEKIVITKLEDIVTLNEGISTKNYNGKLDIIVAKKEENKINIKYPYKINSQSMLGYTVLVFDENERFLNQEYSFNQIILPKENGKYTIFIFLDLSNNKEIQYAFQVELK